LTRLVECLSGEEGEVKSHRFLTFGLVLVCALPVGAHAQTTAPAVGALDAVVREIRELRRVLEKQGSAAARAQLLIARLSLQDQRVARARQRVERLESDLASAQREQDQMQTAAREIARSLEQVTDDEQRRPLERESRMIRTHLVGHQAEVSMAETRLSQAKEALDSEAGRYEELEARLGDLDRLLQAGE
jgi:DNA repair exonuclease SbcCD ATPase subunit